jgi:hypothetical protein
MGVNIDKARRQYPPLTIYFLLRRDVQRRSDSHYSVLSVCRKGVIAMKVDWLFKNVTVIDGSGGPQYRAEP